MNKKILYSTFLLLAVLFFGCSKEYSYETGNGLGGTATGTLKDSSGNCQNITVNGNYIVDTVMTDSNYVVVKLNVTTVGKYKITTDTVNGFWFNDSSYVLSTGTQNIKLKAHGKPILPLSSTFTVTFATSSSSCTFTVPVTGSGSLTSDYFPMTANSNWTYQDSNGDTLRATATNTLYSIGGNPYTLFVYNGSAGTDSSVYRKDGLGNYYQYSQLDSTTTAISYIFLKDNVANGTQWETAELATSYIPSATKVKYRYTMINNNTSIVINGITFNNVIKIQEELMYYVSGTYSTYLTDNSYYAQGIGFVYENYPAFTPPVYRAIKRYQVY